MGEIKLLQIYYSYDNAGPGKVIKNLVSGLKIIDYPYTLNEPPIDNSYKLCLSNHSILQSEYLHEMFIGPNIVTLPIDSEIVMNQNYKKFIVNSEWTFNCYNRWLPKNKIVIWPVGIDTNLFNDKSNDIKSIDCLLYFKNRDNIELEKAIELLNKNNQTYTLIKYGHYQESEFINYLSKCRYCFVIGGIESQGIAYGEIQSCNIPIFAWELNQWADRGPDYMFSASTLPYWDDRCGIKTVNLDEEKFKYFLNNIYSFNPRDYILQNLTLESQATKIITLLSTCN